LHGLRVAHIGDVAMCIQSGRDFFECLGAPATKAEYGALFSVMPGQRGAQSAGGAGDENYWWII
jgi:hypothetical protein